MNPKNPFKTGRKGERAWQLAIRLANEFDRCANELSKDAKAAEDILSDAKTAAFIKGFEDIEREAAENVRRGALVMMVLEWMSRATASQKASAMAIMMAEINRATLGKPNYKTIADALTDQYPDVKGMADSETVRQRVARLQFHLQQSEPFRRVLETIVALQNPRKKKD